MFSFDRWQEIWDTLVQNKLRTVLTMLAMSWGIFMLVVLLGLGRGLSNGVQTGFADDAVNSIYIFGGQTSLSWDGLPVNRRINFDNGDVDTTRDTDGVEYLSGRFTWSGEQRIRYGDKVSSFDVRAVHPGHLYLEKTEIINGRFLNETDITARRKVAVVGIPVAEFLFDSTDVVGEWIDIGKISFQVIGVFDDEGGEG